jgi:hypothetical protein
LPGRVNKGEKVSAGFCYLRVERKRLLTRTIPIDGAARNLKEKRKEAEFLIILDGRKNSPIRYVPALKINRKQV